MTLLFEVTHPWRYSTNNFDRVPEWKTLGFDDSNWPGGPGLLWVDTRSTGIDPAVQPKNTEMPANPDRPYPFVTYYFRSHFMLTNNPGGAMLMFSNYIDDGAVFYLNGAEVHRNNLPPAPAVIANDTLATAYNGNGDATRPVLFSLTGSALANLVPGDNLLAVEVHNYNADSPDITFGSALFYGRLVNPAPVLRFLAASEGLTLYWNGSGYVLQKADQLTAAHPYWSDVPGPVVVSPYRITDTNTAFYRLRSP